MNLVHPESFLFLSNDCNESTKMYYECIKEKDRSIWNSVRSLSLLPFLEFAGRELKKKRFENFITHKHHNCCGNMAPRKASNGCRFLQKSFLKQTSLCLNSCFLDLT